MINDKKNKLELLLYILPGILLVAFIYTYPIIMIIKSGFFQIGRKTTGFTLSNFQTLFQTPSFISGIKNNFLLITAVPIIVVFSILFAAILYDRIKGWKFYRLIIFMSYVLPVPVIGIIFVYIYQLNGILNTSLKFIGLDFLVQDWLGNPKLVIWTIMTIIIWKMLGFSTTFLLARMMSIEKDLFEQAEIDGCNWFQKNIHITIPQCSRTIGFLATTNIVTVLAWVFAYLYTTTKGGPGVASMVTELVIYNYAFVSFNFSMASATAFILLLVSVTFIILQTRIRAKEDVI